MIQRCCAIVLCSAWLCATAHAQDETKTPSQDPTEESVEVLEARELFLRGRKLINEGQSAEACIAFERSQKLVPTIGTLLNLGMCHSDAGRLATAHDYYRQAEVLATLQRDSRRREHAHNEAAALAPRRASLTLRIPVAADAQLDVRVDDAPLPREVWSNPMYIDAGEHRISVETGDHQVWRGSVLIVDGNKHVIVIPEFRPPAAAGGARAEAVSPAQAAEVAAPTSSLVKAHPELQHDTEGLGTTRSVALGIGGAGLAALGAGLVFTLRARSTYDDSSSECRSNDVCSPKGLALRDDAFADANRATVFGIAGGAAVVSAVVLWFVGKPSEPRLSLKATPNAVTATFVRPL
jgi:hypothetical protein